MVIIPSISTRGCGHSGLGRLPSFPTHQAELGPRLVLVAVAKVGQGTGLEQGICPSVCLWSCTGAGATLCLPVLCPSRHLTDTQKANLARPAPWVGARGKMRELTSGLLTAVPPAKAAR